MKLLKAIFLNFTLSVIWGQGQNVEFKNGDSLSGVPSSIDENGDLVWISELFKTSLTVPITSVERVSYVEGAIAKEHGITSIIHMNRGDLYSGDILSADSESITLQTSWGGALLIDQSKVDQIEFVDQASIILPGIGDVSEWRLVPNREKWLFQNGEIRSSGRNSMCKEVPFPNAFHCSMNLDRKKNSNFKLFLMATEGAVSKPASYLEVLFQRDSIICRSSILGDLNSIGKLNDIYDLDNSGEIDLYCDVEDKVFSIYIDGKSLASWPLPEDVVLGEWLYLLSDDEAEVSINKLVVRKWNGSLPQMSEEITPHIKSPNSPIILMKNGDFIDGDISSLAGGVLKTETDFGAVEVALSKLSELDFSNTPYDEAKREAGDVKVRLVDSSIMTLRLVSWDSKQLIGYSQNLADEVSIQITEISTVDFNIYAH